jgi:hypothetical protein
MVELELGGWRVRIGRHANRPSGGAQLAFQVTAGTTTLVVERLPAYAPELNPLEVTDQAHKDLDRLRRTPHLLVPARRRPVGLLTVSSLQPCLPLGIGPSVGAALRVRV